MVVVAPGEAGGGVVIPPALLIGDRGACLVLLTEPSFEGQLTVRIHEGESAGSSRLEAGDCVAGETVGSLQGVHVEEGDQLGPGEGQRLEMFLNLLNIQFSSF